MSDKPAPSPALRALEQSLSRLHARHRLPRGRGESALPGLLHRLRRGEVQMDEATARSLSTIIDSCEYALEDAQSAQRRATLTPWS